jgi:soluble lytic murein transglycosylase-like protein
MGVAADGSVRETQGTGFEPFGYDPRDGAAPPAGTDFEDAIRLTSGGLYSPADLATLPRSPVQEALDQIARIYAGFGTKPSSLLDRQGPSTGMVAPGGGRPFSPYAVKSSLSQPAEPTVNPVRRVEGDYLPMAERPFGSPSSDLPRIDPQLAPPPAPESLRAPDDQGNPLPWLQADFPSQLNSEPLLGRRSVDAQPVSLPMPTTGAANPATVFDDGTGAGTLPANDDQIAQAPRPRQRTQNPSANPKQQRPEPQPPSEQQLQAKATKQASRLLTWEDVIRKPLPEQLKPEMQKPLPADWEGTLNKINPNYLKWTKAAAEKRGIAPELLARLFYKESNYNGMKASSRGAKGIAQLTPIAVKALGLDSNKFDYLDAEKSIDAGAALLAMYYGEFKDWRKAVAAYNMGNTAVREWFGGNDATSPGNEQTQFLLQHVFRGDPHAFGK